MASARAESVSAAEAAVAEAAAALQHAQAELTTTALQAPFAGVVTALTINEGEMVQPGAVVLTLADLAQMQAETTDLSERDVGRVAVGQAATVFVEALNSDLPGHVTRIAPQATILGGDVVYTVVVALAEQPPALRWGMSVEVKIVVE
jgi:HlyD family secretion protein